MAEAALPPVTEGPFEGMIANSRVGVPPGFVALAQNFYLDDGVWLPRPGMQLTAALAMGAGPIQGVVMFEELDSTQHLLAFADGLMYEYDWTLDTWTETDTMLSLDPDAKMRFANSRGRLICTNGVDKPFMVEAGSPWTFTSLTLAPISNGVKIYYDKAFFSNGISGAENSFEWSNEGDPTAGYFGSDQSWQFAQTDFGAIVAMEPLNELLTVFKRDSGSMLLGAVDDDFRTNAVREGISETEGAVSIDSAVVVDGDVYVLSPLGPRVAVQGQRWQSLHHVDVNGDGKLVDVLADLLATLNLGAMSSVITFQDKDRALVGWLVPTGSSTDLRYAIVLNTLTQTWSVFSWDSTFNFTCTASVEDPDGNKRVAFGTSLGRVWIYGDDALASDGDDSAIEFTLRSRRYGLSSPTVLKRLIEVVLKVNRTTEMSAELRPMKLGITGVGRAFGSTDNPNALGRFTYRRGFNLVDFAPGWEFYLNNVGQVASIESAITTLSSIGVQAKW